MHAFKTGVLAVFVAVAAMAQTATDAPELQRARQAVAVADAAGGAVYAKTLMDEATFRLRSAQENWANRREDARMRALEAAAAADAAAAKARWLSSAAAVRGLDADIVRLGGTSSLNLPSDEPATMTINRGSTTASRIAVAQAALDQANVVGAAQVPDNDLQTARQYLDSAKRVARGGNSDAADHLAYRAEMIARRAYYLARQAQVSRGMPTMQMERTRLAQAASERQAAAERAQREQAERRAAELQQQLASEQANRQAQAAEVDRLRQQIDENRRAMDARLESDRQAREAAERQLDELSAKYATAIQSANPNDVDALRRQLEDQQIALRSVQERERANVDAMQAEIARLRNDLQASQQGGNLSSDVLSQRQADILARQQQLDALRQSLEREAATRAQMAQQQQQAIEAAQQRRAEAEAEQAKLRQQAEAATQQAQQALAAAEQARSATQQVQSQLDQTRQELAVRDAEARRLRLQNELARIASTRSEQRGLVVTLGSGILFDSGKSAIKPGAKSMLKRIAAQLSGESSMKVTVEGHTDNVGGTDKNQALSEKRADAVRDYLVSAGVSADRITAIGHGESSPVATNKTAAGRQQNRRVELVIQ